MHGGYEFEARAEEPTEEELADRRRRRRVRRVGGLATAVLAAGGWVWIADAQRDRVSVTWSGPVTCTGTDLVRAEAAGAPVRAARLVPGMACKVAVQVRNDGWFPVALEQVVLPTMGPGGGAAVQVRRLDGQTPVPGSADAVDATFAREATLRPTQTDDFVVRFTFRPEGCTAPGTLLVEGLPEVTVSALGLAEDRSGEETAAFRGTRRSDACSS